MNMLKILFLVVCMGVIMVVTPVRSDAPGADMKPVGAEPAEVVAVAPVPAVVKTDTPCFVVYRNGRIIHDFTRACPEYGNPLNGDPVYQ